MSFAAVYLHFAAVCDLSAAVYVYFSKKNALLAAIYACFAVVCDLSAAVYAYFSKKNALLAAIYYPILHEVPCFTPENCSWAAEKLTFTPENCS